MSLAKEAQTSIYDEIANVTDMNSALDTEEGVDTPIGEAPGYEPPMAEVAEADAPEAELEVSDEDEDEARFLIFDLDNVPGAENQDDIVEPEIEVEEEPDDIEVEERDPWDWQSQGLGKFLPWLHERMHNVPGHSGYDTSGLERAISYFEVLDKEISKAMRMDFKNEIDVAKAEEAREQIEKGLERMVDRLEKVKTTKYKRHAKKKKKSDANPELVKEAQKATHISGITVTVPLLISHLARVCINSMVSAGRDIEDTFVKLAETYSLTNREKAELMQLLSDMNYPVRRDRGYLLDETPSAYSTDGMDWNQNFPG